MLKCRNILLLLLTAIVMQSCGVFVSPEIIGIKSVKVRDFTINVITADLVAEVFNPNNHQVTAKTADIDVLVGGTKVGKLLIEEAVTIQPQARADCKFKIVVPTQEALKVGIASVNDILTKQIEANLKGSIYGEYWFFKKKIRIDSTIKP